MSGTISVTLPSDGDTIDASDVNNPINTIVNAINGGLNTDNLDPAAGIKAAQLNFGGSGAGIWWEEIGRTTLAVAGDTLSVASLPARKYLKVIAETINTGGTNSLIVRFNNDSGANYAYRAASAGGADTTAASATELLALGAGAWSHYLEMDIVNVATREKLVVSHTNAANAVGAGNIPGRLEHGGKWSNTAAAINRIDVINSTGTGDYAIGSQIVVLGHD